MISTLLLDADGVVQFTHGFRERLGQLLQGRATFEELSELERPALVGGVDLAASIEEFFAERGITTPIDELWAHWFDTKPEAGVLDLVRRVRQRGVPVYLATNQQELRGRHMRQTLGYEDAFDGQFYSWELGLAKPDPAFFAAIVQRLGVTAGDTLFIDDVEANTDAARAAGLVAEHHDRDAGAAGVEAILRCHGLL